MLDNCFLLWLWLKEKSVYICTMPKHLCSYSCPDQPFFSSFFFFFFLVLDGCQTSWLLERTLILREDGLLLLFQLFWFYIILSFTHICLMRVHIQHHHKVCKNNVVSIIFLHESFLFGFVLLFKNKRLI